VSDQKRKESPSPRSRSKSPFYNGIRGDFKKYLKIQTQSLSKKPDGFSSKSVSPHVRNSSNGSSSDTRSSSAPRACVSAFDRLHASPTKASKVKEEYQKQCREKISEKIKKREMERNGECRVDYGTIPASQACDMYYRGMAELAMKDIEIAKHSKQFQTKLNLDQIISNLKMLRRGGGR
jgi:hypothetical protein